METVKKALEIVTKDLTYASIINEVDYSVPKLSLLVVFISFFYCKDFFRFFATTNFYNIFNCTTQYRKALLCHQKIFSLFIHAICNLKDGDYMNSYLLFQLQAMKKRSRRGKEARKKPWLARIQSSVQRT